MEQKHAQAAFQIEPDDNVATALSDLATGTVRLLGDSSQAAIDGIEGIPAGHKIAVRDIAPGEDIVKYGVAIGAATAPIKRGAWVHLHCMGSKYDEASNHVDPVTGTLSDTQY